jgi:soluble lytic murein transglycosylase-like protein
MDEKWLQHKQFYNFWKYTLVAQWITRSTSNRKIVGSNPIGGKKK